MDGVTLEGVLAWMEKQQPCVLQAVLHKGTSLLTEQHGNNSPGDDIGGMNEDEAAPNLQAPTSCS